MGEKKKKVKAKKRPLTYGAKGVDVTVGHKDCVPKGKFPYVPKEIGWLWICRDVPGLEYRPDWRPGAVRRSVVKLIKKYSRGATEADATNPLKAKRKSPKTVSKNTFSKGSDTKDEEKIKPAFVMKRKDGDFFVTLQQLKDPKDRRVIDYPYTDDPPYRFHVRNQTQREIDFQTKKRECLKKYTENLLFQQAFDNICRDIFENIDKDELQKLATENCTCMCQALQTEILNNFAQSLDELPPCESPTAVNKQESVSEEENWRVEYTPPIAKYDPNRKMRPGRQHKGTQFEIKSSHDDDDDDWRKKSHNSADFGGEEDGANQVHNIEDGVDQKDSKDGMNKDSKDTLEPKKIEKDKGLKKDKKSKGNEEKGKGKSGGSGMGPGNFTSLKGKKDQEDECCSVQPCEYFDYCPEFYCCDYVCPD